MKKISKNITISAWMLYLANGFLKTGRERSSKMYTSTLQSFLLFNKGKDIKLKDLDANTLQSYQRYLIRKGLVRNTISFYMRILRSAYNKAIDKELVPIQQQFRHVCTTIEKTKKRAIPIKDIKRINKLRLKKSNMLDFARDIFMFSFYTRGMSFIDIANLRKENIKDGYLIYHRQKTGQTLKIKIEPCMEAIILKYESSSPFLFPIYRKYGKDRYKEYQSKLTVVNRNLKTVGKLADIDVPLTMYVARHSWATGAKEADVPIAVISEALGHESVRTTQVYLASFERSRIDEVNRMILRMV